jgi:DNA sulfur modification protein DndD
VSLSAGERQLYALALLQALRQMSGRQLPLLIDTPLARLDEHHRSQVLHEYLPHVSSQVILFTTDAEIDDGLLAEAEPFVARVYRLDYDPEAQETRVTRQGRHRGELATTRPRPSKELIHVA